MKIEPPRSQGTSSAIFSQLPGAMAMNARQSSAETQAMQNHAAKTHELATVLVWSGREGYILRRENPPWHRRNWPKRGGPIRECDQESSNRCEYHKKIYAAAKEIL